MLALTTMSADSRGPRVGWWLVAAGILACRPASVNEAAQRVHPAVNIIQGPARAEVGEPRPAPAAVTTPSAAIAEAPATDAAALLAAGQAAAAVAALALQPLASAGSPEWFVQWALRGRAERLRGQPQGEHRAAAVRDGVTDGGNHLRTAPFGKVRNTLDEFHACGSVRGLARPSAARIRSWICR